MRKEFLILIAAASLTMLAACTPQPNGTAQLPAAPEVRAETAAMNDSGRAFRIDFKTEPASVAAGTSAELIFTVKNRENATVKDVQIVHEKPLHLLIVSEDLAEFYHLHPEQTPDGSFRLAYNFPHGGEYRLYADFTPLESTQVVEKIPLKVAGAERPRLALTLDANLNKTVGGLRVEMTPNGKLKAGEDVMLNFRAYDAATGAAATDLQNYLGELAHFVIISEDGQDFVHAHPMKAGEHAPAAPGGHHHHGDSHDAPHSHTKEIPARTKKTEAAAIAAHVAFPRGGLYKIWAQFQRDGRVIDVPFVVRVAEADKTVAKKTDVPADAVKIIVNADGYTPAKIDVKKGAPVKLAFTRADAENCGGEIVFPKLNIRKKLPVGETVVVELTPAETGELAFTCGMNMYRGALLVN